jgi:hypothetical protein
VYNASWQSLEFMPKEVLAEELEQAKLLMLAGGWCMTEGAMGCACHEHFGEKGVCTAGREGGVGWGACGTATTCSNAECRCVHLVAAELRRRLVDPLPGDENPAIQETMVPRRVVLAQERLSCARAPWAVLLRQLSSLCGQGVLHDIAAHCRCLGISDRFYAIKPMPQELMRSMLHQGP